MIKEFTERQKLYLCYLALDFTNSEIARVMNIAESTLYVYYQHRMIVKTRLNKREDLVEYAKQHGYGEQTNG